MISPRPILFHLMTRSATAAAAPAHLFEETRTAESSPLSDVCTQDPDNSISGHNEGPILQDGSQASFYENELQDHPMTNRDDEEMIQDIPERPVVDDGLETLGHLFADITYFRERWLKIEEKHQQCIEDKRLAHSLGLDPTSELPDTLKRQNDTIISLQRRTKNQQQLLDFLKLEKVDQAPSNTKEIVKRYHTMTRNLRLLAAKNIVGNIENLRDNGLSVDMQELRKRVHGNLETLPAGLVIQSLAGAAICDWVFSAKLQSMATIRTPLLEAYRFQISTACKSFTAPKLRTCMN
jgi:hypothetical protein